MRTHLTVTLTDVSGSRHYSLPQLLRRFLLFFVIAVFTALLLGSLFIHVMYRELTDLSARRESLETEHKVLQQENRRLDADITERTSELQSTKVDLQRTSDELQLLTDDLEQIEVMIGLAPSPDAGILDRIDVANQTATEKALMLQSIPGGWPIENHGVNSPFGMRDHPVTGKRRMHQGIDLKADEGMPVVATADGIVEFAGKDTKSGFGILLVIVHSFGFKTYFGHLKSVEVKPGEFVEKGRVVAYSGRSGRTTGPHLHYEIRRLQARLDPEPLMGWDINNYAALFEQEGRVPWDSLAKAVKRKIDTMTPRLSRKEPPSVAN